MALHILRIRKLCANLKIAQPISRLHTRFTQSRDYAAPVHNLEIAQFLLRTQVIVLVSIMYKGKEHM